MRKRSEEEKARILLYTFFVAMGMWMCLCAIGLGVPMWVSVPVVLIAIFGPRKLAEVPVLILKRRQRKPVVAFAAPSGQTFEEREEIAMKKVIYHTWIEPTEEIIQRIDAECGPTEPTITITQEQAQQIAALQDWAFKADEQLSVYEAALNHNKAAYKKKQAEARQLQTALALHSSLGRSCNCGYH